MARRHIWIGVALLAALGAFWYMAGWAREQTSPAPGRSVWEPVTSPWFLILALALIGYIALSWAYPRHQRLGPGHCTKCGYNLTGNVSGRCPECGAAIEPESRKTEHDA